MEVRMRVTQDGYPDPRTKVTYFAGQVYALSEEPGGLGEVFLREGWAELVTHEDPAETDAASEEKARVPAANKMRGGAKNKGAV